MECLSYLVCRALLASYSILCFFVIKPLGWLFLPLVKYFFRKKSEKLGFILNGERLIDPKIVNDKGYIRVLTDWTLGAMEGIVDGDIVIEDLKTFFEIFLKRKEIFAWEHPLYKIFQWFNLQTPTKAWEVGEEHYNLGFDLWEAMLGKRMMYSCAYWKDAKNLDEAQDAKMHLIAKKLHLKPGMRVLDIGCGWGELDKFLAENYGVSVVGYTISSEQKKYFDENCRGLPVEIRLEDYRAINEKFDRIVSVEMLEHVGARNYKTYFNVVKRAMGDDGLFLMQTTGRSNSTTPPNTLFIHKYIFRNGYMAHQNEIAKASEDILLIEDWHNIGYHFYLTWKAWRENLEKAWPVLEPKYGARFRKIWTIYLQLFEALCKTRQAQSWQIVFSKDGHEGGYESIR